MGTEYQNDPEVEQGTEFKDPEAKPGAEYENDQEDKQGTEFKDKSHDYNFDDIEVV